jgi:hypothetical protein
MGSKQTMLHQAVGHIGISNNPTQQMTTSLYQGNRDRITFCLILGQATVIDLNMVAMPRDIRPLITFLHLLSLTTIISIPTTTRTRKLHTTRTRGDFMTTRSNMRSTIINHTTVVMQGRLSTKQKNNLLRTLDSATHIIPCIHPL